MKSARGRGSSYWSLDACGGDGYGRDPFALEEANIFSLVRWSLVPEEVGREEGCDRSH